MPDILTLRRKRGEITDKRTELVEKMDLIVNAEGDMTDEMQGDFDALETEVNGLDEEVKAIDVELARAKRVEELKAKQAKPMESAVTHAPTAPAQAKQAKAPGTDFSRITQALVMAKGSPLLAASWAEKQAWDNKDDIAKALGSSTAAGGGYLVPTEYSNEIIELLRAKAVIFQAGPRIMPLNGTLEIPRITAGVDGGYIGENSTRNAEQQTFGNLKLTSKKLFSVVPVSNDLIRNADPRVDAVVRDDIVSGLSVTADVALLRDKGDGAAPKGLRYWAKAANLLNSAGTTAANIESDFSDLMGGLQDNNVAMVRPVWFMAPRSFRHLYKLRDANGNLIYPELRQPTPTMYGYPIFQTTSVPTNLGGGTATEIMLVDMNEVIIGEETGIELMASDVASYNNSAGTATSAFSNDQTVIRAIMRHDQVVRHDSAVAVITDATWGA